MGEPHALSHKINPNFISGGTMTEPAPPAATNQMMGELYPQKFRIVAYTIVGNDR